jgi:hypothetical protein
MGRGNNAKPLQLRISTLEDTVDSVHTTVHALETTMSEIVTLLRDKQPQEAKNLRQNDRLHHHLRMNGYQNYHARRVHKLVHRGPQ